MYIVLEQPSLSFAKQLSKSFVGKYIIVYTNQLSKVTRSGLIKHLLSTNKLSSFNSKFSTKNLTKYQIEKFEQMIFFRTLPNVQSIVIQMLLQKDQNLSNYKISYPLSLIFQTAAFEEIINSLTQSLSLKQHFQIIQKIGEGTFAEIYLAREIKTQYIRVVKVVNKQRCARLGSLDFISNQYQILKNVQSPWHVQLYYLFEDRENVYFVIECCPYGNIYTMINQKFRELTLQIKYTYFIQMCLQLCRLHQHGYIYRDLKPQNILIDYKGNAKLCDFGYTIRHSPGQLHTEICGSYQYIPPQLVNKQGYNHSHDIYCLGLFFYQMLTGTNPFKGIGPKNIREIHTRKINFEIQLIGSQTKNLLKLLLQPDHTKRIGAKSTSEIFHHPFFYQQKQLLCKIIQNQKLVHRNVQNVEIKMLAPRKIGKEENNKKDKIMLFGNQIYNYLRPVFNVTEKIGPMMISNENKNKSNM